MVVERFYPHVGGSETQALNLSRKLQEMGIKLFVLTRRTLKEMAPYEEVRGIRVYRVLPNGTGLPTLLMASFSFAWFLFEKRNDYDIIHCHGMGWAGPVSSLMGMLLRKKTIVKVATAGDISGKIAGKKEIPQWINAIRLTLLKRASGLICISYEIADELRKKGFPEKRLVHIANGVDIERFALRDEKRKLLPQDKLNIIFSGRLVYRKGIDVLLEAFKRIVTHYPQTHLHILGSAKLQMGDEYEDKLRGFVRDNNLKDAVTFHGDMDNVEDYLKEADIFAFPSRHEGLPNALLEAMACGLPVVATSIGGIVDVIKNGENGILVEPDDVDGLCKEITGMINSTDLRERLGKAARNTVEKGYSLEAIAGKYLELYGKFMEKENL